MEFSSRLDAPLPEHFVIMGLSLGSEELAWTTKLCFLLISMAVGILAALIAALLPYSWASSRPKNFPPGPKPVPFLGNLNLIPPSKSFALYVNWLLNPPDHCRGRLMAMLNIASTSGHSSMARSSGSNLGQPTLWC